MSTSMQLDQALAREKQGDPQAAYEAIRRLTSAGNNDPLVLLHGGRLAMALCRHTESLDLLGRAAACDLDPRQRLDLSTLYFMQDCFGPAIAQARIATEQSPGDRQAWGHLARLAVEGRDPETARQACLHLLSHNAGDATAAVQLASLDAQAGDFEQAERRYRAVLEAEPHRSGAIAGLVKCRRFEPGEDILDWIERADVPGQKNPDRARLHFARAKVFNDWRDYDAAWQAAREANGLKRRLAGHDRRAVEAQKDLVLASARQALADGRRSDRSEAPLLIVGMPRSGTTLVEQMLADNPRFYPGGEVPAFERTMARIPQGQTVFQALQRGQDFDLDAFAEAYLEYFRGFINFSGERIINKVPTNFFYIGLFLLLFPRGHVVNLRRHPLDVAVSIYFENFAERFAYTTDLDDIFHFRALYEDLMAQWRTLFPDRILDLDYEALVTDPEGQGRELRDFLGVSGDSGPGHESSRNRVETPSVWQVRQPFYRHAVARWRRYEKWLADYQDWA
ncbi:sulfotransferase [Gammaproteobacteria bacterium AB-CW1]|uniref:Sulfotransferase n=1 Tax=Natronospira elongata TaxID=3110268 RepID=A0AAP6JHD5_9GAMM|nr:sulfotransferase [Gammaproteobacteria bacterium AB-CW1]